MPAAVRLFLDLGQSRAPGEQGHGCACKVSQAALAGGESGERSGQLVYRGQLVLGGAECRGVESATSKTGLPSERALSWLGWGTRGQLAVVLPWKECE